MRWFLAVFILLLAANTAAAQVDDPSDGLVGGTAVVVPPIAPIPYGFSNSVIDHNGRLWIVDVTYEWAPLPNGFRSLTRTTRVTVIESDATTKRTAQFSGAFQIVGIGRQAVYAIVTDYATFPFAPSPQPVIPAMVTGRWLVPLGPSFPNFPSLEVPSQAEVKVSAVGDDGAPDTIAFVDIPSSPRILEPTGAVIPTAVPTRLRTVQMFQSDGKSFTPLTPSPIPIP